MIPIYFFQHRNLKYLISTVNDELESLCNWFKANRLSINVKKTNFIIFSSPTKIINIPINIKIDGSQITPVASVKFLGVYIDQYLNWNDHIQYISSKIAKTIGIINKIKYLLNSDTRRLLYNSLILPYLTYCNMLWINASKFRINRLIVLQKKIIRIIAGVPFLAHTETLFHKYGLLKLTEIGIFQKLVFMYRFHNNLLPNSFNNYFQHVHSIHNYGTRGAVNDFFISFARTNLRKQCFKIAGPKLWNLLNPHIRQLQSLSSFKSKLKSAILHNLVENLNM